MSKFTRVGRIITAFIMILGAVFLLLEPDVGYPVVLVILAVTLLVSGIRMLVYYFTMARHMVGGRTILYRGTILLDIGIFAMSLSSVPQFYVILYLQAIHGFSGAVSILRALEAKKSQAPWKLNLAHGLVNIAIVICCLFFTHSAAAVSVIYASGLIYSACFRIASAFRRTAVAYIR